LNTRARCSEFWTGLQLSVDLYRAQKREAATLKKIHRYKKVLAEAAK